MTSAPSPTDLVASGALFAVNHSGGKDSQAMLIRVAALVPREQLVVVHASLGAAEWPGALEHAQQQAGALGAPFLVARPNMQSAPDTANPFLSMVEHRHRTRPDAPAFPQAANRQCTSDLKRGPIQRETRRYAKAHGFTAIVTCMGMRAAESPKRKAMPVWRRNDAASTAGREWFEWLPIHDLSTDEVFEDIRADGQQPHPAYAAGNERLSCVFCIMASRNDLRNGALANPGLYREYVEMERRTGYTLHQSRKTLPELTGIPVEEAAD